MQEGTTADKDLRAGGQLGKLVAHYVRTSNANYDEIDLRLKGGRNNSNRVGNGNRGGEGSYGHRGGGGSYELTGNKFKVDTSQAVVSEAKTTVAQNKWAPSRGHILKTGGVEQIGNDSMRT